MPDPWGRDQPPTASTPAGWRALHDAPLYSLLPAAWPARHRTWVPGAPDWSDELRAEQALLAGLPEPPTGRTWVLRSPWPRIPVSECYRMIWSIVERDRREDEIVAMFQVATDVLAWDEARAWAALPVATRDLLDRWSAAGRSAEDAVKLVHLGLSPTALADACAATGLDERALLAWAHSLDCDLDEDAIAFVRAWRSSDLPGDPPPDACRFRGRDLAELSAWLSAGFDLDAADVLAHVGLQTSIRWRAAGIDAADTRDLLAADSALTPDEAGAFDDTAGAARTRRRDWVYYGFDAASAAAWAQVGLTPYLARIWRACGRQPGDVQPGQNFPPQLLEGRRYFGLGKLGDEIVSSEWDELPDPPGTRGRWANWHRSDDDVR